MRSRGRGVFAAPFAAAALLAASGLVAAAPAEGEGPARFVYEVCDPALPGGSSVGAEFHKNAGSAYAGSNSCAQPGGSISIAETGHVEGEFAFWTVPVTPPGGITESLTVTASACGVSGASRAFVLSAGWPASACGVEQVRRAQLNPKYNLPVWVFLGCDASIGSCEAGPSVAARDLAATNADPVAPSVSELGGSLLGGGVQRGHQSLRATGHDVGGGLAHLYVQVNGQRVGDPLELPCRVYPVANPSVSGLVTDTLTPCPAEGTGEWTLDTQSYPFRNGSNRVEVCAEDFSTLSAANLSCAEAAVQVDNTCTPSAVPGGELLSASFPTSGSDSVVVPFGRPAEVSGRLTHDDGEPVPGATLCVRMATMGIGERGAVVGSVKTDASGHYSYLVKKGPNREVAIGYREDAKQLVREVSYYAHARPSLRLAPAKVRNGDRIRIWGTLPGPHAGGHVVVLQASAVHSDRWLTFRKATSRGGGRFRASYRFDGTPTRTVYKIRAVVPSQSGYPWVQGHSRAVRVTVTG